MRFKLSSDGTGTEYHIQFHHEPLAFKPTFYPGGKLVEEDLAGDHCDRTTCKLYSIVQDGSKYGLEVIALYATVERYHLDPPNREKARKAALAKALRPWPKEQREVAWKAYLGRKGKVEAA